MNNKEKTFLAGFAVAVCIAIVALPFIRLHEQQQRRVVPIPEALQVKNTTNNPTYVRAIDINGDGVDELVYYAGGMSWYKQMYIYSFHNGIVSLLCEHCAFDIYGGYPLIEGKTITTPDNTYKWQGDDFIRQ